MYLVKQLIVVVITFMHLADAFIHIKIQVNKHSGKKKNCQYVCSLGIEPTTFVLVKQCSTTEPQEHTYVYLKPPPGIVLQHSVAIQNMPISIIIM